MQQDPPGSSSSSSEVEIEPPQVVPQPYHVAFTPQLDSNIFRLSSAEMDVLQLPSHTAEATLLLMEPGQSLVFVGTACITLLRGAVTVLGTPITASKHAHRVFSPRSSPLATIEVLDVASSSGESSASSLDIGKLSIGGRLPQRVEKAAGVLQSVVIMQRLRTGVEGLGKICRTFDGVFHVDKGMRDAGANDIYAEGFHLVDPYTHPHLQLQPFFLPDSWKMTMDAVIPPPQPEQDSFVPAYNCSISLIRGPKNTGKSTFARTLLNRMTMRYKHVAFLECDLGQSEFTPGGMVSLHVVSNPVFGPPFTHPRLPYSAHYVGNTTPRSNPSYYLSCIQALVQTYRMNIQYSYQETSRPSHSAAAEVTDGRIEGLVPLVVNTHGWVKGLGGDLLRKIEEMVEATDVFDLDEETMLIPKQRLQSSTRQTIHALEPIPTSPLASYFTSADHRSLAILSHFYCVFPLEVEEVQWVTDLPLCARLPWSVDCREAFDQIILVGAGYEDVVAEELSNAINCGVVALICNEDFSMLPENQGAASVFPYTQGAPPPDPNFSHCVGLALVRGVDAATGTIHVLTSVPPRDIARCRVLVKGELELPVWGFLDFRGVDGVAGIPWGKVPYLQGGGRAEVGVLGAGAGRIRVRRNLMRRGQIGS